MSCVRLFCVLASFAVMPYISYAKEAYPITSNMFGIAGGVFLTSNPDMMGYNTKKSYVDGGGGLVYGYRRDVSVHYAYEVITSFIASSCSTSKTEDGQSKVKFIIPLDLRWNVGWSDFKFYVSAGLQYNFIYALKESKIDGNTYGYYDYWGNYYQYSEGGGIVYEESTSAHQLSANTSVGVSILGSRYRVHILLGTRFHIPIINNAEGVEYANGSRFDLSRDKFSVVMTGGVSVDVGKHRRCIMMLNYDYPLDSTKETFVTRKDDRNFFELHSQSLTMSIMFRIR